MSKKDSSHSQSLRARQENEVAAIKVSKNIIPVVI